MKTTKQIINDELGVILNSVDYDVNNALFEINKNKRWYSEKEIKKAISKCYSYGHAEPLTEYYDDKDDNLICIAELEEHLFAPDLNSRSSDEDSLNKD